MDEGGGARPGDGVGPVMAVEFPELGGDELALAPATGRARGGLRAVARHAGWAPRTFARRFLAETGMTPRLWLTAARLREARRLLEVSDLPVDDVAARSGLGSAANLRLHLARDAGTTPTAYRATYQGRDPHAESPRVG